MPRQLLIVPLLLIAAIASAADEDIIELQTTTIRGAKELPKVLYLVPWKDVKPREQVPQQELVLHSLFGDLFEPVSPGDR